MQDLIGHDIGRYHITEQLGQGGMAVVYKAFDTRLEREVAVKLIRRGQFGTDYQEHMLKRFEREAKSLAKMLHPNIVPIYDYGEHDGAPYLVMAYIPGGTLKQRTTGQVAYPQAAHILAPVVRALEYAHQREIIHRDVKPANILVTQEGVPMLSDFGVAKILESDEGGTLTGTGVGVGTPEYMAPEQWVNKVVPQTDIYSLGVVFYELITGRKPYTADTPAAVLIKQANEALPRPKTYVPGLPDEVERVIFKAMAKEPKSRYENMGDFAAALEKLSQQNFTRKPAVTQPNPAVSQDDTPTSDEQIPVPAPEKVKKIGKGNGIPGWTWALIGILVLALVGGVAAWALNARAAQPVVKLEPKMSPKDGMTLLYVPEGNFLMGSDPKKDPAQANDGSEQPQHTVWLDAFWIDRTDVTNAMYAKCVAAGACGAMAANATPTYAIYYGNSQFDDYPVVHVDWNQADTYCRWAGRELPSEAQWEKAARGTDGRIFPWGNDLDPKYANYDSKDTSKVGAFPPGASPYGALDMAGNVWQWVADWYDGAYYQSQTSWRNPIGPVSGQTRVLRGASWSDLGLKLHAAARRADIPSRSNFDIGFRCAVSAADVDRTGAVSNPVASQKTPTAAAANLIATPAPSTAIPKPATETLPPAKEPAWKESGVLFADNFESGKAKDWTFDGAWNVVKDETGNFILQRQGSQYSEAHILNNGNWKNYAFEARIKILQPSTASFGETFDLLLRTQGTLRYKWIFNQSYNNLGREPDWTQLSQDNFNMPANTWFKIRIEATENVFRGFINGEQVFEVIDSKPWLLGGTGFSVQENAKVWFDDVRVIELIKN